MHPIPDEALDADIAILGKKGRGKTYTAKGIVERLLEMQRRVLVLDPLSTWWGLRSNATGDGPGHPVAVFGGPHGDMPITEKAARPLARLIAANNMPVVVDMGEMRKAAWQRLVRDMLDELFTKNRDPLWIVLEEADVFAPQQPREGDSAAVLGEVDRIARRGRNYGFRLISITQRPARLHKDVLTQLSTLVALGMTSPQDRDAIKAWVEGNADRDQSKAVMDSLAKLPVGEGWVWAPDHDILDCVRFPQIKTLDTSFTPKAGEKRIEPSKLADVDLSEFREALQEAEGDEKPAETKTRAPSAAELSAARQEGYEAGLNDGTKKERQRILSAIGQAGAASQPAPRQNPPERPAQPKRSAGTSAPALAERLLAVLDTNPPILLTWTQVCSLAQRKARGGAFNAARKWLIENEAVLQTGDLVQIAAPSGQPADDGELWRQFQSVLPGRAGEILEVVAESGPISRAIIAARMGLVPRGGSWNAIWKVLRDNRLVEIDFDDKASLTDAAR